MSVEKDRAPDGFFWGAYTVEDSWSAGRFRHLVRDGGLDTLCGNSASYPEVWSSGHPKPKCEECLAKVTPEEAPPSKHRKHALTVEWNGEYGSESSSNGVCRCGAWGESASSQREVRFEYREHLERVKRNTTPAS